MFVYSETFFFYGKATWVPKYSYFDNHTKLFEINKEYIKYNTSHIGVDSFITQDWNSRLVLYQSDIQQVLWRCGYDKNKRNYEDLGGIPIPEVNFDAYIINDKKEEEVFQRPLCWSLQDKQLLIDSIYNYIEIGKVILRKRSWKYIENRVKSGKIEKTAFFDCIDGKQRINTLLQFINNEFADSEGNYWYDLSEGAKRKFFNFRQISYGELEEGCSDTDALTTFLKINHAGVPQSIEHLNFVKSIKLW